MTNKPIPRLVTCEHAVNTIPPEYAAALAGAHYDLRTHRGYDAGALELARLLAKRLSAPLFYGGVSRLLVDLNRSLHHPRLWSEYSRRLGQTEKQAVLATYYHPYRQAVEDTVRELIAAHGGAAHFSIHTFTPVLDGIERHADLGLLYDPSRRPEAEFCLRLKQTLLNAEPAWRIRRNYPYRGQSDGLVSSLRRFYPENKYIGLEFEVNQCLSEGERTAWTRRQHLLIEAVAAMLGSMI